VGDATDAKGDTTDARGDADTKRLGTPAPEDHLIDQKFTLKLPLETYFTSKHFLQKYLALHNYFKYYFLQVIS
jgi:hypothetical protein